MEMITLHGYVDTKNTEVKWWRNGDKIDKSFLNAKPK